eukprot:350634-Chlamydomonas_euryale.AAC.3
MQDGHRRDVGVWCTQDTCVWRRCDAGVGPPPRNFQPAVVPSLCGGCGPVVRWLWPCCVVVVAPLCGGCGPVVRPWSNHVQTMLRQNSQSSNTPVCCALL